MNIYALLAGLFSGMLGAMGLGGGSVLIIYLTVFGNVKQLAAGGTNLLFFIPIALIAVIIYAKNKQIKWKTVVPVMIGGALGALIGIISAAVMGDTKLSKIFGIFLIVIGVKEIITAIKNLKNKSEGGIIKKE